MKIIVEVKNGRVVGIYGNEKAEVDVYYDIDETKLSDEENDFIIEEIARVPFVLYADNTNR